MEIIQLNETLVENHMFMTRIFALRGSIYFTVLLMMFSAAETYAQLPGSLKSVEDTAVTVNLIIIGQISEVGPPAPTGAGKTAYAIAINVVEVLKGTAAGTVTSSFRVLSKSDGLHEMVPQEGKKYIFFVATDPKSGAKDIVKISFSDSASIEAVKRALKKKSGSN